MDDDSDGLSAEVEGSGEGDNVVGTLDRDSLVRNPLPQSVSTVVRFEGRTDRGDR